MLGERLQTLHNALLMGLRQPTFKPRDLKTEMDIALRIEKLSGKVILEKNADLVTRHYMRWLYNLLAEYDITTAGPSITVTDTGGVGRTTSGTASTAFATPRDALKWSGQGALGETARGIVIGIGTTAPTRIDYALQSLIAHGGGVGQITYNQQTYAEISDYQFRFTREFTNAGSNINVSEAGYYCGVRLVIASAISVYNLMFVRDVFTPVPVTTGNGIRVRYTWGF